MNLAQLRDEVRRRADMEHTQFVTDDELNVQINQSYSQLYDILVSRFEDYYSSKVTVTIGSGSTFQAPADMYKVRGLDYSLGGNEYLTLTKFNFQERNLAARTFNRIAYGERLITYRLMGQTFYIEPEDQATGTYRLWYIPRYTPLVSDSDEMGDVLDFEDYVIVDAAIKCIVKEESDPSALMAINKATEQRIVNMAANRDAGSPERVTDVSRTRIFDQMFPRL
jgi:hypothetical protein